jgi:hypothetical protein
MATGIDMLSVKMLVEGGALLPPGETVINYWRIR